VRMRFCAAFDSRTEIHSDQITDMKTSFEFDDMRSLKTVYNANE
jgi:hypothetical protein